MGGLDWEPAQCGHLLNRMCGDLNELIREREQLVSSERAHRTLEWFCQKKVEFATRGAALAAWGDTSFNGAAGSSRPGPCKAGWR